MPDLAAYERDPGLYLDYRTEMIGTQVVDTAGVAAAILAAKVDLAGLGRVHRAPPRAGHRPRERALRRAVPDAPERDVTDRGRPRRVEVVPFRAMSATSEAPAAFRNAAGDPGALRLIREGIDDIRSRRRLVRYLVTADMRKRGADTLLGNLWWVLDPLLQMVVYVVFVTIIVPRHDIPDYPLFIFAAILPWKWFTASVTDATTSVAQPGPAHQADRSSPRSSCRSRPRPPAWSGSRSGSSRSSG